MNAIGSATYGGELVAIMPEQPAMVALATQNQALMLEVEALKKQQAAMQQLFQQMVKQNERLAAANAGGSALLKETVQHLDIGQSALAAENELLRQEITLLKAEQEEANAQHGDEVNQKDGQIAEQATTIEWQKKKIKILESAFSVMKSVSSSDFVQLKTSVAISKYSLDVYDEFDISYYLREHAPYADALTKSVEDTNEALLNLLKE
jgi:chemotaxis receptor (MCP) glutamine deamidase CheD